MSFTRESTAKDSICLIWIDDLIDVFTWRTSFGIKIETPHLDQFMAEGLRFSNAYATVPLCAPCRAELATGLSPFHTGLVDLNRFWRDVLPPTEAWQFDLRRAGFKTFTTGKVDSNYKPMPEEYRRILFHEEAEAKDRGQRTGIKEYLGRGPGIKGINHPNDDGRLDRCFYDYDVSKNAIAYLDRADPNRRHLIQLGFKHPHFNLECPDRFYQLYDPSKIEWPSIAASEDYYGPQDGFAVYEAAYIANGQWTPEKAGDEAWRQVVRAYFAAVSHVDHEIGRFMSALRASPLGERTSVILLSDNGFNLGNHDSFHKMSQWDSAAHIPLGLWHAKLAEKTDVDLPVSLHNLPKTILDLAGLPPRSHWTSGQSLLPLIDDSFGTYDTSKSPVTSVFGTLSVRPSVEGLSHLRYFRYPNGEEHVYDIVADPGETTNLIDTAPIEVLRDELIRGALELGLDLRGFEDPAKGINAMMAVDGTVMMEGGIGDSNYWAYGADAEKIKEDADGGNDTLWYLAGPDDYVLHAPAHVENIRIATVVSRTEAEPHAGKPVRIVAHPDSPITFECSERVTIDLMGSRGDDVMIGPKYADATFYGGSGNDTLISQSKMGNKHAYFYGGSGDDTLIGGRGNDVLDGGTGNDEIHGGRGRNKIFGGHGNDEITDGSGTSEIHTGPGRNTVTSEAGNDHIFVGAGVNVIDAGEGDVTLHVAYGGVTRIKNWRASYCLDLSSWPDAPHMIVHGDGVRLTLGMTVIDIEKFSDIDGVKAQVILPSQSQF